MSGNFDHPNKLPELQKLALERIQERRNLLREEFQRNLKTIQNLLQNEEIQPIPEGGFQKIKDIQIMDMILKCVTNSEDKRSLYDVCLTFRDHYADFMEERKRSMIPQVLKILHSKRYIPSTYSHKKEWKNILNLRLISESWKLMIDSEFFGTSFSSPSWHLDMSRENWKTFPIELRHFRNEKDLDKAIQLGYFLNSSLFRCVYINASGIDDLGWSKAVRLAQLHWSLCFKGKQSLHNEINGPYRPLVQMTRYMTNLKSLILSSVTAQGFHYHLGGNNMSFIPIPNYVGIPKHPFMNFRSLEHFECEFNENQYMLEEIFAKSLNLKTVVMSETQLISQRMSQALQMHHLERFEDWNIEKHVEVLDLRTVTWPLKVLSVCSRADIKFSRLVPVLNHFHGTLETLKLRCSVEKDESKVKLELPKLKFLHLHNINYRTVSLDDMVSLKSMEKLVIKSYDQNEFRIPRQIRLKGRLQESNIWNYFPYLRQVVFLNDGVAYVRKGSTITKHFRHMNNIALF